MTVPSATNRINYTGNGAVDTYSYTFPIFDDDDLLVTVRDTDGVETTLVKTTDYTVTGAGEAAGGTVVLVNSSQAWLDGDGDLLTDYVLSIRRVLDLVQETDIANQGRFYPETHEDQFDKLVMIDQQQQDEIDRSVKLPETVDPATFDATLPADLADFPGAPIVVNAAGDGFDVQQASVPQATVSAFMETVLDDTTASAARTTLGFTGASGTVATGNIEALAVTAAKLAADAVTTVKILDLNVTTAKIADANVTKAKLAEAVWAATAQYGGASAGGTDTYAVTPSPAYTAYATGMIVGFKADVANTGGATLNVNGLGAKTLVDRTGTALETGAIIASQMVVAVYDGTNFQVISPLQSPTQVIKAWVTFDASSGTPVIGSSFNVTSITDNGVGDFTINFTTAFADTNYAVMGSAGNDDATNQCVVGLWGVSGKAVGSCRVRVYNLAAVIDAKIVHVVFMGAR